MIIISSVGNWFCHQETIHLHFKTIVFVGCFSNRVSFFGNFTLYFYSIFLLVCYLPTHTLDRFTAELSALHKQMFKMPEIQVKGFYFLNLENFNNE